MSKHTPGPWAAIPDCPEEGDGDWYVIAENEDVLSRGSSAPDARLIAAAPDLLAAVQAVASDIDVPPLSGGFSSRTMMLLRDAIAKAEGRS